ncbi:VWA domain-containing protein [Kiritimatiellaeota bacterium B1221]|nr:VWA domain-containing protein [Kiritimatiellaeota bacterium B1221]
MKFSDPHWLWACFLVLPALSFLRLLECRMRQRTLTKLLGSEQIKKLIIPSNPRLDRLNHFFLTLGVFFLFLALARPQLEDQPEKVDRLGIDFLVAIDTSRSMLAEDIEPNRMAVSKDALRYLLSRLKGDRMGILAFAGEARMIAPLTFDTTALDKVVESISEKTLWMGGTSITKVIELAAEKFEEKKLETRVLVLITDGEDLEGDAALTARDAFIQHQIQIFTIGVGSQEGAKIPLHQRDKSGKIVRTRYVQGPDRREVISRVDENGLRKIAQATGGEYYPVGEDNEGAEKLYDLSLSTLAKRVESREMAEAVEAYRYFLVPAIFCLLLQNFFVKGKRDPRSK